MNTIELRTQINLGYTHVAPGFNDIFDRFGDLFGLNVCAFDILRLEKDVVIETGLGQIRLDQ